MTITITDNESAPSVTLTTSATSIAENAGSALTLTATVGTATFEDVTVSLMVQEVRLQKELILEQYQI